MHTVETVIESVPYGALVAKTDINAREKDGYDKDSIAELAALIEAKGLLQNLVVRPSAGGKYEIMAGKRRYLAIGVLIKKGVWPSSQDVPVAVRNEDDEDALETSLIENIAREPMHPIQEYRVFAALNGDGKDEITIAKRYGITVQLVRQRLALGGLAPEVMKAWENDDIGADVAEAFAVCPDRKRQAKVFKELKGTWRLRPQAAQGIGLRYSAGR